VAEGLRVGSRLGQAVLDVVEFGAFVVELGLQRLDALVGVLELADIVVVVG